MAKNVLKKVGIKGVDQKILWSRAAGRCSMCKKILTFNPVGADPATLGEMAHIVAAIKTEARGRSTLSVVDRSKYSNLILLCPNHHTEIDKDEKKYSIEFLHKIKVEHEMWVTEKLGNSEPTPDELVYSDLIDTIEEQLQLSSWDIFIDGAVRDILHVNCFNARGVLNAKLLGTIWPSVKPALKSSIKNVLTAYNDYLINFEQHMDEKSGSKGEYFGPDYSYKCGGRDPHTYRQLADEADKWSNMNYVLLCNYVVYLNEFCNAVRKFSNPMFYRIHGDFLIKDSLGYRHNMQNTICRPTKEDVKKMQIAVQKKIYE